LESTYRLIIDAVAARKPDDETDLELAQRTRKTMNVIAPKPQEPISRGSSALSLRKIRDALSQCTEDERKIVRRRYGERQTIEEIAGSLVVKEDYVSDVLRRVKQRTFPAT